MNRGFLIAAFVCLAASGCKKATSATPAPPTPVTASESPAPAQPIINAAPPPGVKPLPAPPPPVAARADNYLRENVAGDPDPFLSGQLRTFIEQKHRLPESFAEFAMSRLDSIPRPPEGKKWVIDTAALQVKASPAK